MWIGGGSAGVCVRLVARVFTVEETGDICLDSWLHCFFTVWSWTSGKHL